VSESVTGVMGYQGGSDLHMECLARLGIRAKKIFKPQDFQDISGLIMPGGESSAQYLYCNNYGIKDSIIEFANTGKTIFATCAGAILLSRYSSSLVKGFDLLDLNVERNAYGRQIESGIKKSDKGNDVLFIRAPVFTDIGSKIEVLDSYQQQAILVRQENIWAATYHPECLDLGRKNIIFKIFGDI